MINTVTISKTEYDELKEKELILRALVNCGVDNWEGYDDAMDYLEVLKDSIRSK